MRLAMNIKAGQKRNRRFYLLAKKNAIPIKTFLIDDISLDPVQKYRNSQNRLDSKKLFVRFNRGKFMSALLSSLPNFLDLDIRLLMNLNICL